MGRATRNIVQLKVVDVPNNPPTVIIPAAGEGSRMKTYGPKSLIKILPNITLIQYQVNLIRKYLPHSPIILITGHEAIKIMGRAPAGIIHIENERYQTTHISKSLAMGLRATITNRVLIIYGDLVFNAATLKQPLQSKSLIFIDNSQTMTQNEIGCTIINDYVEHMLYDLPIKWSQIVYLQGKELELFKQVVFNPANEKLLGFEILNMVINDGGKFLAVYPKGSKVNDIDCARDLIIIQQEIL